MLSILTTVTSSPRVPRRRPGEYANGRATRRSIVEAAAALFAQQGFNAATVRDIAAAANISRPGLHRHFADKEALLHAVIQDRDDQDRTRFDPYATIPGGVGILQGMVELAKHNEGTPGIINLFIRLSTEAADSDHPAHQYFRTRYDGIRTGTARALRSAAAAGYLRDHVDADNAAARLTALMDGLQVQWLLEPSRLMHPHVRAAVEELLTPAGIDALEQVATSPHPAASTVD